MVLLLAHASHLLTLLPLPSSLLLVVRALLQGCGWSQHLPVRCRCLHPAAHHHGRPTLSCVLGMVESEGVAAVKGAGSGPQAAGAVAT